MDEWIKELQDANAVLMDAVLRNTIEDRRKSISLALKDNLSKQIDDTISNISESAKQNKDQLRELVALPINNLCADCGAAGSFLFLFFYLFYFSYFIC